MRTVLKITGKRDSQLYFLNEIVFAAIFIIVRVLIAPWFLIYIFESAGTAYPLKLGVCITLFVGLLWANRIIELVFEALRAPYAKKDKTAPLLIEWGY